MKKQLLSCLALAFSTAAGFAQGGPTPTPQWRPLYHFTPLKNWTNDPNGLIYLDGVYHLYNQQNPYENKWGHMSWGHAVSTDLVHWKHLPVAIPETIGKDTTWIFSGCAVWDKDNSSGFCKEGCLVAVYTVDQPNLKKESQFVSYSLDGGMTFTGYAHNPVIDLQKKDFRDPNVSWNDELKKWVMVVALPAEHTVRFYASDNLKEWNLLSEFGNAGYTGAAWECPFLVRLPVDGNPGKRKWALVVSAAGPVKGTFSQYFTGDFRKGVFTNDNPADRVLPLDYGDCFYAAIPWNNLPGDRKTFIGWMVPGSQETFPWNGQMSIPRDLSLKETAGGLRLLQEPSALIRAGLDKLSGNDITEIKYVKIGKETGNASFPLGDGRPLQGNSWWLEAELVIEPGARAGFRIAQKKDGSDNDVSAAEIGYDAVRHQLYVEKGPGGKTGSGDRLRQIIDLPNGSADIPSGPGAPAAASGDGHSTTAGLPAANAGLPAGPGAPPATAAGLPAGSTRIRLEILFDKSSLEIFINGGEKVLTTHLFPDTDADGLSLFSEGGNASVRSLVLWNLSGIR